MISPLLLSHLRWPWSTAPLSTTLWTSRSVPPSLLPSAPTKISCPFNKQFAHLCAIYKDDDDDIWDKPTYDCTCIPFKMAITKLFCLQTPFFCLRLLVPLCVSALIESVVANRFQRGSCDLSHFEWILCMYIMSSRCFSPYSWSETLIVCWYTYGLLSVTVPYLHSQVLLRILKLYEKARSLMR